MAIVHVQDIGVSSGGAASVFFQMTSATTAGNQLIATFGLPTGASVISVTDSTSNRWIQAAFSETQGGNCEIWQARGIVGGVASVTAIFSRAASIGVNAQEYSGCHYASPLDQWGQNVGTSASPTINTLQPRQNGNLIVAVTSCAASVNTTPPTGFTALTIPGGNGYAAAYEIEGASASVAVTGNWNAAAASTWGVAAATFLAGPTGVNPMLQFPETEVEISTQGNFQAPFQGTAIWTNISNYVKSMTLGPIGRQHELDRVQSSPAQITVDNRQGIFNPWNSTSFLYDNGSGMRPMNPVKVTAAWNGITYPVYYGYIQGITPQIADVLNVDAQIQCYDILQMMALKYLSNDNYAQQVIADGGSNLAAYYRLGDSIGSTSVKDSSNNNTGSLINGPAGLPAFGGTGAFLYDPNGSLDLTNGTNAANSGFTTTNNLTEPPTVQNPLGGASVWAFECWAKWTSNTLPIGQSVAFTGTIDANGHILTASNGLPSNMAVGNQITGPPANITTNPTIVTSFSFNGINWVIITSPLPSGSGSNLQFGSIQGGASNILFSANTLGGATAGIGAGQFTSASVTRYNTVTVGHFTAGVLGAVGGSNAQNVQNGAWHHIAVNYSASVASIYIDGNFDSQLSVNNWANPSVIAIGCYSGPTWGWAGAMEDVALYTTNLTAAQIKNHYQIGTWFQQQEFGASVGGTNAGRFNKLLAVIGLNPSQCLNVPYAFRTLMYSETNQLTTVTSLNYGQTQAETEPGLFYQQPNGMLAGLSRQYTYLNPTSVNSQCTIGDNASASIHYAGPPLQITGDDLDVWNDVPVQSGRTGSALQIWGPTQSALAASSASVTGSRTLQGLTSLQQQYDSDALAIAQNYIAWYANPVQRISQVSLNSFAAGGNNIPQILGRGLFDQVTVQYSGQAPGPQFSQSSLIEQLSHTIDLNNPSWTVNWTLSPYELTLTPFLFGNNKQSQLGGAASVTGSGSSWIHHPSATNYLSGNVVFTVSVGSIGVPWNATASQVQTALATLVPGTTCSGGPLNSSNVVVAFGSSQTTFSAVFSPSQVLTL